MNEDLEENKIVTLELLSLIRKNEQKISPYRDVNDARYIHKDWNANDAIFNASSQIISEDIQEQMKGVLPEKVLPKYAKTKINNFTRCAAQFRPHEICKDKDSELIKNIVHSFIYKGEKYIKDEKQNRLVQILNGLKTGDIKWLEKEKNTFPKTPPKKIPSTAPISKKI